MTLTDIITILPLVFLLTWALVLLLVDLWIPRGHKGITAILAAAGLTATLGLSLARFNIPGTAFNGMALVDGFAIFLDVIFLVSGLVGIALAYDYLKRLDIERGEYYLLLLFAIGGMILMTYANDLIIVFLALELLSLPLYVLSGFIRHDTRSEEAALKYFMLGAFSSGFVLYGIALIYGATAHTDLPGVIAAARATAGTPFNPILFGVGALMMLTGFAFKAAIVPFHMWTPDVYQGAPSSVTSFMSVGAKVAGFAALMRVFIEAFPTISANISPVLWGLAVLTMVTGNVLAIAQTNIKRLLAYSSIAQSGYVLMAFVPYGQDSVLQNSVAAMLFFLATYCLATLGAWAVVIALEKAQGKGLELDDYSGLSRKYPWLAMAMAVFMLSFTGVPLTLGFWGKFYLFSTAVQGGYIGLALIGLLASLVSAYYYLRVIVIMYMRPGEPAAVRDLWINLTAIVCAVLVIVLSFIPGPLLDVAAKAILHLN